MAVRLVNCNDHGKRPPPGSIYIGRSMASPHIDGSPLQNRYVGKSWQIKRPDVVVVEDSAVLEYFKRRLTRQIADEHDVIERLRQLRPASILACWCASRDCVRVGAGTENAGGDETERPCHGDVIFTVYTALDRSSWCWWRRGEDLGYADAGKRWDDVYERCFGAPMSWGRKRP